MNSGGSLGRYSSQFFLPRPYSVAFFPSSCFPPFASPLLFCLLFSASGSVPTGTQSIPPCQPLAVTSAPSFRLWARLCWILRQTHWPGTDVLGTRVTFDDVRTFQGLGVTTVVGKTQWEPDSDRGSVLFPSPRCRALGFRISRSGRSGILALGRHFLYMITGEC